MLGLMVLEIYGVTLIVRRHLCSQLLLLAQISILYDRPWGQFTLFELHNISQKRRHTWSCMKGKTEICRSACFFCCDSACCQGVQMLKTCFTVMADGYISLYSEADPITDGYKNVSQANISKHSSEEVVCAQCIAKKSALNKLIKLARRVLLCYPIPQGGKILNCLTCVCLVK